MKFAFISNIYELTMIFNSLTVLGEVSGTLFIVENFEFIVWGNFEANFQSQYINIYGFLNAINYHKNMIDQLL